MTMRKCPGCIQIIIYCPFILNKYTVSSFICLSSRVTIKMDGQKILDAELSKGDIRQSTHELWSNYTEKLHIRRERCYYCTIMRPIDKLSYYVITEKNGEQKKIYCCTNVDCK